jgi:hypothetical protein
LGDTHVNDLSAIHGGYINGEWILLDWQPKVHYEEAGIPETTADHKVQGQALAALVSAAKAGPGPFAAAMQAEFGAAFWLVIHPCGAALRAGLLRLAG